MRLLYSVVEPAGVGGANRQAARLVLAEIPRPGAAKQASTNAGESIPADAPTDSVFRAAFIEQDGSALPGTPRGTLLWWQQWTVGASPAPAAPYFTRYAVVTGRDTMSKVRHLSVSSGNAGLVHGRAWPEQSAVGHQVGTPSRRWSVITTGG